MLRLGNCIFPVSLELVQSKKAFKKKYCNYYTIKCDNHQKN